MEWHRCELDISASVPPSTHQNVPRCRCGCCTDCCTSATDGMQFVVLSWDKASRQEQHRPWGATVLRPRSTAAIVDGLSWPRLQALPVTGSRRASADGAGRLDYDTDKTKNTPDDQYINANKTGDQFVLGGACQSAACSGTATFTYDPRDRLTHWKMDLTAPCTTGWPMAWEIMKEEIQSSGPTLTKNYFHDVEGYLDCVTISTSRTRTDCNFSDQGPLPALTLAQHGLDPLRRTPMMRGAPSGKVCTWSNSTSADDSSASSSRPRRSG